MVSPSDTRSFATEQLCGISNEANGVITRAFAEFVFNCLEHPGNIFNALPMFFNYLGIIFNHSRCYLISSISFVIAPSNFDLPSTYFNGH